MIIQTYEIQTLEEAMRCIELGVDHIGSVMLTPDGKDADELKEVMAYVGFAGKRSSLIPLFDDREAICEVIDSHRPHILHLCNDILGQEIEGHLRLQNYIKDRFPYTLIMRTIPIPVKVRMIEPFLELLKSFAPCSDMYLLDTWVQDPPVSHYVGITGINCDWEAASFLVRESPLPCILAGGLGPHNVYEAIKKVRPQGVDTCSLTNQQATDGSIIRFKKDFDRLAAFVYEARKAFEELQWRPVDND